MKLTVAEGWEHGTDEYWHLMPVNEKNTFQVHEKVQFFGQVGPISCCHQWRLVLYKNDGQIREITSDLLSPAQGTSWNYSNFVPYATDLNTGSYRAEYFLDAGTGFQFMGSVPFTVGEPTTPYEYIGATTSKNWIYGTDDHWNLQPVDTASTFAAGDKIYLLAKARNVYVRHQWKVELYRDADTDLMLWDYAGNWNEVGDGWNYSNFYPYYDNAVSGNYYFKVYINTGSGFTLLDTKVFTVSGTISDYQYIGTTIAHDWKYGTDDYWNLQPVNATTTFAAGDKIYALAKAKNVYVKHQWKVELYRKGTADLMLWNYASSWNEVGNGWNYSNFYPYYEKAVPGNYEFKIYINTGSGFTLLDTKAFTVAGTASDYTYAGSQTAKGWTYGTDDYWNLQPVNATTTFAAGDKIYLLAKARNVYVRHQWKVELYRDADTDLMLWDYASGWNEVGSGWNYSNFYPYYENTVSGNYYFKVYINTGSGFTLLDTKAFTVSGTAADYTYTGATVASSWTHGTGVDYWNIQPVDARTNFKVGETVYLVAQARNVYINHRWKVDTYRDGALAWSYATPWNNVGSGWQYSSFYPASYDSSAGSYEFKLYFDSGSGYQLLDTKTYTVTL